MKIKIPILICLLFSKILFFSCVTCIIYTYGHFSSVKDFSAATWVRNLKFCTKLDCDKLRFVTKKKQPHIAYHSLYLLIFFLSIENFCHRFLGSFWSQCFQILCTSSDSQSVLCKWKLRCSSSFCLLFFKFSFCHSYTV